jgi:hypothetical protein
MTEQQQQTAPAAAPPANATEAQARINTLTSDKAWTDRLLNGDRAALNEYQTLVGAVVDAGSADDVVASVMAGSAPKFGNSEQRQMAGTVDQFRELGISDDVTKQFLSGQQVTPQEYQAVVALKRHLMSDPEYVESLLGGNVEAKRKMTTINVVLVNGVKLEPAA